ncbi:MAG: DUF1906 domain-containing protein, partial [Anaerolineales bacterium]
MRNTPRRILLVAVFIPLLVFVLLLITLLPIISTGSAIASTGKYGMRVKDERTITVSSIPTPTQTLYLPLLAGGGLPVMESMQFFITDTSGEEQLAFLPGDPLVYHSQGTNNLFDPIQVIMQITQTGPSTPTLIYSESLSFDSGLWDHDVPSNTLVYSGIYTTTAKFVYTPYQTTTTTLLTRHVVNPPSKVITSTQQGFDKCYIPTVEEMSTWWNESPYSVFNLYMGGISFFCDDQPLDALWVHEVARQGWTFIPTWVGPQAPCSGFNHRMSANPVIAYGQGRDEALDAFTAAKDLGLLGDTVIYYDLEGYSGDAACRATVQEFLKGWNERLHELNQRAGIYGSPCRSYVTDWAVIEPPPDDVWIAHWYTYPNYYYDPDATVWGEICGLTDEMWPDHQRIKQYTGGHSENWGGTSLVIDSNVLDGEITSIPLAGTTPSPTNKGKPVVISQYGVSLDGMGLINPSQGWVLVEGRLLLTSDYGLTWSDVTPSSYTVLAADFLSPYAGWIVGRSTVHGEIALANTLDSGQTWQMQPLPELSSYNQPLATEAYIQSLDQNT